MAAREGLFHGPAEGKLVAQREEGKSFCPDRRRNQLKTINSAKAIQGNQSLFL
jgi:hypothetical protein